MPGPHVLTAMLRSLLVVGSCDERLSFSPLSQLVCVIPGNSNVFRGLQRDTYFSGSSSSEMNDHLTCHPARTQTKIEALNECTFLNRYNLRVICWYLSRASDAKIKQYHQYLSQTEPYFFLLLGVRTYPQQFYRAQFHIGIST